jgi:hypothetical protein
MHQVRDFVCLNMPRLIVYIYIYVYLSIYMCVCERASHVAMSLQSEATFLLSVVSFHRPPPPTPHIIRMD